MNNNFLIDVIIGLIFVSFYSEFTVCLTPVTGRCGRPPLPPKALKHLISPERSRFEDTEKIIILCKKDEFPLIKHEVVCRNGQWTGKQPRCGRHMDAQVVHLDIFDCQSNGNQLIVAQPLNQTLDAPAEYPPLRPNSFHTLRVTEGLKTSAKDSDCYSYKIRFEKKVQIWFLLIDVWIQRNDSSYELEVTPVLNQYRSCALTKNITQVMGDATVVGYYFICDLKNVSDFKREESELSDTITVNIKTNFTEELGLEAIFIGDVFTDSIGSRIVKPDCGQIGVTTIGVDAQEEVGHTFISCNDSFVDINTKNITNLSKNGNAKHKFMCTWNGIWEGDWPMCVPKVTCPVEDIQEDMDSNVIIEEIGNVYYLNESKWYAINDTFIRYVCVNENDIMVGKKERMCLKTGQWNSKPPLCTRAGTSSATIAVILFAVLVVFVLIVLFVFRTHSRRVNRELRETRNEISGSQIRKRCSEEFYADFKSDNFYDNNEVIPKSVEYETVEYDSVDEQPRYLMQPQTNRPISKPEYLDMLS